VTTLPFPLLETSHGRLRFSPDVQDLKIHLQNRLHLLKISVQSGLLSQSVKEFTGLFDSRSVDDQTNPLICN